MDTCLRKILYKLCSSTVLILTNNLSRDFHLGLKNVSVINMFWSNKLVITNIEQKPDLLIVDIDNYTELASFLAKAYREHLWDARTKTIFVNFDDNQHFIKKLVKLSWKYFMFNFLVVTKALNLYRHSISMCTIAKPYYVGNCTVATTFLMELSPKQFQGCIFRAMLVAVKPYLFSITSSNNSGLDYMVLKEIAKQLNVGIELVQHNYPFWGTRLENGSYTNIFQDIYLGSVDLTMTFPLDVLYLDDFDYSVSYTKVTIPFWTQAPKLVSPWTQLFLVFSRSVWAMLGIAICVMYIPCLMFRNLETSNYKSLSYCIVCIWRNLFTPLHELPTKPQLKFLFVLWTTICYIIASCFQGRLITTLFHNTYQPQITTLEELGSSNLEYGGHINFANRIRQENTALSEQIYKNYIPCNINKDCLVKVLQKPNFAVFKATQPTNHEMKLAPNMFFEDSGRCKLSKSNFEIVFNHVIYVRKGFPLLNKMNEVIYRLTESGLTTKWDFALWDYTQEANVFKKVTLDHLFVAFVALLAGNGFAAFVFVAEIGKRDINLQ